jgi:hypothetical protein
MVDALYTPILTFFQAPTGAEAREGHCMLGSPFVPHHRSIWPD